MLILNAFAIYLRNLIGSFYQLTQYSLLSTQTFPNTSSQAPLLWNTTPWSCEFPSWVLLHPHPPRPPPPECSCGSSRRGCLFISICGGVRVSELSQGMSNSPQLLHELPGCWTEQGCDSSNTFFFSLGQHAAKPRWQIRNVKCLCPSEAQTQAVKGENLFGFGQGWWFGSWWAFWVTTLLKCLYALA